jgi:hypothetical protein
MGADQRWQLVDSGSGLIAFSSVAFPALSGIYKIVNRNSGMAVDVLGASTSDGGNIVQWGYGGADNQHWKFESVGGGAFEISSQRSGKLIDVFQASAGILRKPRPHSDL